MVKSVISKSKDIMGGTKVFEGTRVPVETFLEYLEAGDAIDDFLDDFPSVKRKQVLKFLDSIKKDYTSKASAR